MFFVHSSTRREKYITGYYQDAYLYPKNKILNELPSVYTEKTNCCFHTDFGLEYIYNRNCPFCSAVTFHMIKFCNKI